MKPLSPYTIRPMQPGDIPTVAAIEQLSFPNPWPASSFQYELHYGSHSSYQVLLKPGTGEPAPAQGPWRRRLRSILGLPEVSKDSRVIGYVGLRFQSAEAHVSTIAVHPDWRGKGLGELLLLVAIEQALELGSRIVSLEVRASNRVAQSLYRKVGFHFTASSVAITVMGRTPG
jgi:ribosomal-protein-alanine N-acetyltransferase